MPDPEGYLAKPAAGDDSPGVLVLHAWWGLNQTIKNLCDRLAAEGFTAFAPDLYHGKVAETIPDAEKYSQALYRRYDSALEDAKAAVTYLGGLVGPNANSLAVIGFSMGASYALDLSAADPEHITSVAVFYGVGEGDFTYSQADYLFHYAENDPYDEPEYTQALEEALQKAGRPVTKYTYPNTTHWFFEPDRVDAFNREAANLAWERTLSFLRRAPKDW